MENEPTRQLTPEERFYYEALAVAIAQGLTSFAAWAANKGYPGSRWLSVDDHPNGKARRRQRAIQRRWKRKEKRAGHTLISLGDEEEPVYMKIGPHSMPYIRELVDPEGKDGGPYAITCADVPLGVVFNTGEEEE